MSQDLIDRETGSIPIGAPSAMSNFLRDSSTLTAHITAETAIPKVSKLTCLIQLPPSFSTPELAEGVSYQVDTIPSRP